MKHRKATVVIVMLSALLCALSCCPFVSWQRGTYMSGITIAPPADDLNQIDLRVIHAESVGVSIWGQAITANLFGRFLIDHDEYTPDHCLFDLCVGGRIELFVWVPDDPGSGYGIATGFELFLYPKSLLSSGVDHD